MPQHPQANHPIGEIFENRCMANSYYDGSLRSRSRYSYIWNSFAAGKPSASGSSHFLSNVVGHNNFIPLLAGKNFKNLS